MISIREEIAISMPPDVLWPILSDPSMVASCIPGAALTKSGEGGTYQGTMRVTFGPTVALFRGEAKLVYDHSGRRCTIQGRGIDGRGASRANASGTVEATGGDTTPPTTSITSPASGATVSGTTTVSASASDNVGVTKVEFYLEDRLVVSRTRPPYSVEIDLGEVPRRQTVRAVGYDSNGRVIDEDATVKSTLRAIRKKYPETELIFANGGDRSTASRISEADVCEELSIALRFGVGGEEKADSSTRIVAAMSGPE